MTPCEEERFEFCKIFANYYRYTQYLLLYSSYVNMSVLCSCSHSVSLHHSSDSFVSNPLREQIKHTHTH